jgi:uncharacterized protein (DUF427 family)
MRLPVPDPPLRGRRACGISPRPPIAQPTDERLRVVLGGITIADTVRGARTIETSHPPTYYFPREDIALETLRRTAGSSLCEWKGAAIYFDIIARGEQRPSAAWSYPEPTAEFEIIRSHVAFYAAAMDACFVGNEKVEPRPGRFYGGWITSAVARPFKGMPGDQNW